MTNPTAIQRTFTGPKRTLLVTFVHSLTRAMPSVTVADTLALLLAARRLRSYPDDAADVLATIPQFPCVAAAGVLTLNLNSTGEACFDEFVVVPSA